MKRLALTTLLIGAVTLAGQRVALGQDQGTSDIPQLVGGIETGQRVRAEGRTSSDGTMSIERLRVRDADSTVRVESQISELGMRGETIVVLGFVVEVPANARVLDGDQLLAGPEVLRVGDRIEVRGTVDPSGRIRANRVRRSPLVGTPRDEMEAPVERVLDSRTFEMLGRRAVVSSRTRLIEERTGVEPSNGLRRDDDEPAVDGMRLGGWGAVGGRVEAVYAGRANADLDAGHVDERTQSSVQVEAAVDLGPAVELYAKVQSLGTRVLTVDSSFTADTRVKEANVRLRIAPAVDLQVGRLRLRDSFEWFADDYLDALRIVVNTDRTAIEAGASYGLFAPASGRSRSDERQLFATLTHEFSRTLTVGTFLLARDDRTRDEAPVWMFVETTGRAGRVRYWANTALLRGRRRQSRLQAWAVDSGANVRPGGGGLVFTIAYAVGSGDPERGDAIDRTFRSTGLDDTETRFAGFKRIHSYGELLQPELSNLQVLTTGAGWQGQRAALDVVHHAYRQVVPRRSTGGTDLDLRPTGEAGWLGQEVDGLLTFRPLTGIDLTLTGGVFLPGPAHAGTRFPAVFWDAQIQFFF